MIAQTIRFKDMQPLVHDVVSILNYDPNFVFYSIHFKPIVENVTDNGSFK